MGLSLDEMASTPKQMSLDEMASTPTTPRNAPSGPRQYQTGDTVGPFRVNAGYDVNGHGGAHDDRGVYDFQIPQGMDWKTATAKAEAMGYIALPEWGKHASTPDYSQHPHLHVVTPGVTSHKWMNWTNHERTRVGLPLQQTPAMKKAFQIETAQAADAAKIGTFQMPSLSDSLQAMENSAPVNALDSLYQGAKQGAGNLVNEIKAIPGYMNVPNVKRVVGNTAAGLATMIPGWAANAVIPGSGDRLQEMQDALKAEGAPTGGLGAAVGSGVQGLGAYAAMQGKPLVSLGADALGALGVISPKQLKKIGLWDAYKAWSIDPGQVEEMNTLLPIPTMMLGGGVLKGAAAAGKLGSLGLKAAGAMDAADAAIGAMNNPVARTAAAFAKPFGEGLAFNAAMTAPDAIARGDSMNQYMYQQGEGVPMAAAFGVAGALGAKAQRAEYLKSMEGLPKPREVYDTKYGEFIVMRVNPKEIVGDLGGKTVTVPAGHWDNILGQVPEPAKALPAPRVGPADKPAVTPPPQDSYPWTPESTASAPPSLGEVHDVPGIGPAMVVDMGGKHVFVIDRNRQLSKIPIDEWRSNPVTPPSAAPSALPGSPDQSALPGTPIGQPRLPAPRVPGPDEAVPLLGNEQPVNLLTDSPRLGPNVQPKPFEPLGMARGERPATPLPGAGTTTARNPASDSRMPVEPPVGDSASVGAQGPKPVVEPANPSLADKLGNVADAADARMKARAKEQGAAKIGIDPRDLADIVIYGAAKIGRGLVNFADWSAHMVQRWGEEIRPHLDKLWRDSVADYNKHIRPADAPMISAKATAPRAAGMPAPNVIGNEKGKVALPDPNSPGPKALRRMGRAVMELYKLPTKVFDPSKMSQTSEEAAAVIRSAMGKRWQDAEQFHSLYNKAILQSERIVANSPKDEYDRPVVPEQAMYEYQTTGRISDLAYAKYVPMLDAMDEMGKGLIREVKGPEFQNYQEHYLSQIYANPQAAEQAIAMTRRGTLKPYAGFLKERVFPNMREAFEFGQRLVEDGKFAENPFTPKSWNILEQAKLSIAQKLKWREAHDVWTGLSNNGMIEFVRPGEKSTQGWVPVPDKVGKVIRGVDAARRVQDASPQFNAQDEFVHPPAGEGPVYVEAGEYYTDPDVARLLDNHLGGSPYQGSDILPLWRSLSNVNTQVQLLGAFHFGLTTIEAQAASAGHGLMELVNNGRVGKAAASLARGAAPGVELPFSYRLGAKVMKEYTTPGSSGDPWVEALTRKMVEGGARPKSDAMYTNGAINELLLRWYKKQFVSAAAKTPGAALEAVNIPLMKYHVPSLKMAAAIRLTDSLLTAHPDATPMEQMRLTNQALEYVDNSFGQMVLDNTMQNRLVRAVAQVYARAYTFGLGTGRIAVGTAGETAAQAVGLARTVRDVAKGGDFRASARENLPITVRHLTPNQATALGRLGTVAVTSAVIQAILTKRNTGKMESPDYLTALGYWKTGLKNDDGTDQRGSIPGYIAQGYGLKKQGGAKWLANRASTLNADLYALATNSDWRGREIRNEEAPIPEQIRQMAKFYVSGFTPFSLDQRGSLPGLGGKAAAFVGSRKAPAYVTDTPALAFIKQRTSERDGKTTYMEGQKQDLTVEARGKVKANSVEPNDIQKWLQAGVFKPQNGDAAAGYVKFAAGAKEDSLRRQFRYLTTLSKSPVEQKTDTERAWSLMSPEERKKVADIYAAKMTRGQ